LRGGERADVDVLAHGVAQLESLRSRQSRFQLRVADLVEALDELARGRVNAL